MAVQRARFAGGLAGCLPLPTCAAGGGLVDEQMRALKDYGALLSAAANDGGYPYCRAAGVANAAQSELTCNGAAVVAPSRKRGREDGLEMFCAAAPSAALLPIPGMHEAVPVAQQLTPALASRMAQSATASTSGRPEAAVSLAGALVTELCQQQDLEIDALVRAECDRLRAGLEHARKRQRQALVRAAAAGAARALRGKEAELEAARRRAAGLEDLLRQAAAESQAWRDAARRNEALAAGLRAALETLLLGGAGAVRVTKAEEGFGDSGHAAAADDAQSCFFVKAEDAGAGEDTSSPVASEWACRACGGAEASVLVLPCRHLCLCKACEPRVEACPVCLTAKTASIHVAAGW